MSKFSSVRVRMVDGTERMAQLTSQTKNGYRSARIVNGSGQPAIRGRVEAKHGYKDGRLKPFEVRSEDAPLFFGEGQFVVGAAS